MFLVYILILFYVHTLSELKTNKSSKLSQMYVHSLILFSALSVNIDFLISVCVCIEDSSDHFKIDANSGEIRTTTMLSYDRRPSYRMTVIASDQGVPPLQGQAVINIQVMF